MLNIFDLFYDVVVQLQLNKGIEPVEIVDLEDILEAET